MFCFFFSFVYLFCNPQKTSSEQIFATMKHRRSNLKTSITDTKTFVVDVLNVLDIAEQTTRVVTSEETYPSTRREGVPPLNSE